MDSSGSRWVPVEGSHKHGNELNVTTNFCVLHNEVEYNYISSSITLGLQLHVSGLYVGHLQVVT